MPAPIADRPPERGAIMPTISVPLLVSQADPPPAAPGSSSRLVPHAVSPRAPTRIAAVTIVRLRVLPRYLRPPSLEAHPIAFGRPPSRGKSSVDRSETSLSTSPPQGQGIGALLHVPLVAGRLNEW